MKRCVGCDRILAGESWRCAGCGFEPEAHESWLRMAPGWTKAGYEDDFFGQLVQCEPGHFWFEGRNRIIQWALRKFAPMPTNFLEVGCGTGFVLRGIGEAFPGIRLVGGELFEAGLPFARTRVPHAELYQMDALNIPFVEEFDAVGAFDVIEHIPDDATALMQMRRSLKPGGIAIISVPQHAWLWTAIDDFSHHQRRYTRRMLRERLTAAGLVPILMTSFVSLLLPLMLASRLRAPKTAAQVDLHTEFRIPAFVNRILNFVMRVELRGLKAGFRYPVGGSLLAVARRPAE